MSAIDKLLKNKSFVSFLSKKLGNVLKQEGIKSLFIVLENKPIDEIGVDDIKFYTEDMVCVPKDIFDRMVDEIRRQRMKMSENEIELKNNQYE